MNAREGDLDAAREVIRDFVIGVAQYSKHSWSIPALPWAYVEYVANALQKGSIPTPKLPGSRWVSNQAKPAVPKVVPDTTRLPWRRFTSD